MSRSLPRLSALLLAFGITSLVGCSDKFTPNDLVGSYALNVGPGSDVLELKGDGTYVHSYQDSNVPKNELGGKWQLDNTPNGEVVTLDNFKVLPGENATGSGYYLLKPTRFFGSIRLMRNLDLNEFYKKQ